MRKSLLNKLTGLKLLIILGIFLSCGGGGSPSSSIPNNIDVATYAILFPEFPCDELINGLSQVDSYGIAFLWNTFGADKRCLARLNNDPKLKRVVVYGANAVCQRNNNCGNYEHLNNVSVSEQRALLSNKNSNYLFSYKLYLQRLANFIYLDVSLREDVELVIFPELESNLNHWQHDPLVKIAREVFPTAIIGYNPVLKQPGGNEDVESFHRESHEGVCIANNDGVTIGGFGGDWGGKVYSIRKIKDYFLKEECLFNIVWHHALSNFLPEVGFIDPRQREPYRGEWSNLIGEFKNGNGSSK